MDNKYQIPWEPLDLSPGIGTWLAVRQQREENERARRNSDIQADYARAKLERESHEELRAQQAEKDRQEALKRAHAIDAWNALPGLTRMAHKSGAGAANANPFGIKFDETTDLAPNQEGPETTPALEAARHPLGPLGAAASSLMAPEHESPAEDATEPREESTVGQHSGSPMTEAHHAAVETPPTSPAEPDVSPVPMLMNKRLWATMNGQRFEVPEVKETTGLGDKYDAVYQRMLEEPGVTPAQAFKAVMVEKEKDDADIGRDRRLAEALKGKNEHDEKFRPDVTTQGQWLDKRLRTSMRNTDVMANAKIQAAAPELKADAANSRDMGLLRQQGAAIRSTSQFNKLAASDKTVRSLMLNIADNAEPLQHRDAQIQLARFFRQAQPTEGEMHLLYNSLGGTLDKWNQFVARISNGDLSPEQLRQLQAAAQQVKHEHTADVQRFVGVAKNMLGPGSGFDNMPDQATQLYRGMGAELGLDNLPPLYDVEGGVTLGSGHRPTVTPKAHPQVTGPHPSKEPVGSTKQIGGKTYRKVGPNNWQPVTP